MSKFLRSPQARRWAKVFAIVAGVLVVAFVLLDDVVMPAYVQQGKVTKVPDVVGMPLDDAQKLLVTAGLTPKDIEYKTDRSYPEGTVVVQTPVAGSEVKFGRGIYLTVSGGEAMVVVPNIKGKTVRDATFDLERFGLKLGTVDYAASDEYFENTISAQEVAQGTRVRSGTVVPVVVSLGKSGDRFPVPALALKTVTEAEKILTGAGFTVGRITYQVSLDLLPNTVIEQYPRSGDLGRKGQAIDLIVAQKDSKRDTLEN